MKSNGRILCDMAYARGKMLDSRSWFGLLPRNITPSDIDLIGYTDMGFVETNNIAIDNNGTILLVEFSTKSAAWDKLPKGQFLLYRNLVCAGHGRQIAALAHIEPKPDQPIDTLHDVREFSVMRYDEEAGYKTSPVYQGKHWKTAVTNLIGVKQ